MTVIDFPVPDPTWVYQLYCKHGGLLYVGIAYNLERRLKQHRGDKPWWPEVAKIDAYQFPTRMAAREAELAAITVRQPFYNVADVEPCDQANADAWKQLVEPWELPHEVKFVAGHGA